MPTIENRDFGYRKVVAGDFASTVQRVKETLKVEGFGALTEIDVNDTLKNKLEVDFGKQYRIIGACNPNLAYRALQAETELGLLLPCNVIVYESAEGIVVSAIDPEVAMGTINNPALQDIAAEASTRLRSAVDNV